MRTRDQPDVKDFEVTEGAVTVRAPMSLDTPDGRKRWWPGMLASCGARACAMGVDVRMAPVPRVRQEGSARGRGAEVHAHGQNSTLWGVGTCSSRANPSHTATHRMAVNTAEARALLAVSRCESPRIMAREKRNSTDAG